MKKKIIVILSLVFLASILSANNVNEDLLSAAENGNIKQVRSALQKGANVNAKCNSIGYTALMRASKKGFIEIVKLLINAKVDVNTKSNIGNTALMEASLNGHTEIVKLLISAKADVNAKSSIGITALIWASYGGGTEIVKLLIQEKADVNAKSNGGGTALMQASDKGHTEIVKLLINAKANVNAKTDDGWTALMRASRRGFIEIVKLLKQAEVRDIQAAETIVTGDIVNVRANAGTDSPVIFQVKKGDVVIIVSKGTKVETIGNHTGSWYKIKTRDNKTGYIFSAFLKESRYISGIYGEYLNITPSNYGLSLTLKSDNTFSFLFNNCGGVSTYTGKFLVKGKILFLNCEKEVGVYADLPSNSTYRREEQVNDTLKFEILENNKIKYIDEKQGSCGPFKNDIYHKK